jgi:electron transfer flavoprotein alpha subunit
MSQWRVAKVLCEGPCAGTLGDSDLPLLLVFPASAEGEALAGDFAARNGAAVLGRIVSYGQDGADLIAMRSTHGGRMTLELRIQPGLAVATANDLECEEVISIGQPWKLPIERAPLANQGVSLEAARMVIGGGRGLGADGFDQLERIANALGGAVSASLAAVDLGLAPVSRQVGQSGKFVNPVIYLAAGMSGTPQHFSGVGARARIIAVNSDSDAPIFGFAQTGAVADARRLLPLLADALDQLIAAQPACTEAGEGRETHIVNG